MMIYADFVSQAKSAFFLFYFRFNINNNKENDV